MSYPITSPGKVLFFGILILFLALVARGGIRGGNYSFSGTPNLSKITLYNRDSTLLYRQSGIIRHERNGDIVIALPADAMRRYRIRFFDEKDALLFEIRQIRDPLLIIEKYNFGHAGRFQYELYRDNGLIEKASFLIGP